MSDGFTTYLFEQPVTYGPRCRNTHTLTPLFALRQPNGELVTDPLPLAQVPEQHFWQNSDGYGFDLRNLQVLLRVNFRNLNPHTAMDAVPRPLWCNQRDLASLLAVLPATIKENIYKRGAILNHLSDTTKCKLAYMAGELYSHNYLGLVAWLKTVPGELLSALSVQTDQATLLSQIKTLADERRNATLEGISQYTGAQANQHFAEPAGVPQGSDLYRVLEFYKATVVQDFLSYVEAKEQDRRRKITDYDDRVLEYLQIQFLGICERYKNVLRQAPRHHSRMLLWHWIFKTNRTFTTPLIHRGCRARPIYTVQRYTHVRVFYNLTQNSYEVDRDDFTTMCTDGAHLWLVLQSYAEMGAVVHMATLAGGLFEICRSPAWRRTLKRDNALIQTLARLMVLPHAALFRYINSVMETDTKMDLMNAYTRIMGPDRWIAKGIRDIAHEYFTAALYEIGYLNKILLHGGYDDGPDTLLRKLRTTLNGYTCIQDVAAELCEFLSIPYPPEEPRYAAFQVDHTGIPPVLQI